MSQLMIYTNRKIASIKPKLEHKCVLQESYKNVSRWQRSILLVGEARFVALYIHVMHSNSKAGHSSQYIKPFVIRINR